MAISPTLPAYAGTAVDNGGGLGAWTTPSNATGVSDAVYTTGDLSGGGSTTNYLKATNFGFAIPAQGVIDGIKVEYLRSGFRAYGTAALAKAGTLDTAHAQSDSTNDFWTATVGWFAYGGPTDLWGNTWTPADINNSGFGFGIFGQNTSGGGSASVDAMRITVYWHIANQDVPKRYLYKVLSSTGQYLGNLPNVKSQFNVALDINTAGAQISIECAVSADTSRGATTALTDEAGNILTEEASVTLTDEGAIPVVAPGSSPVQALIKNGNAIQVWEYSYYYPNGKCLFLGQMERWEADFGGDGASETVRIVCYSDGQDLDNYLVRGNPYTYTTDVSQTSQNASGTDYTNSGAGWDRFGQTWKVGAGVTNLGAISVMLNGAANVTISVYADPNNTNTPLGVSTQAVNVGVATEIQFGFPTTIPVVAGTTYFFTVAVDAGQSILVYYSNANPYANGTLYESVYGGAGGGGYAAQPANDLYFKTASGTGSTIGTFTALDPSTGMLETFMNDYIARGGLISYTAASIQATGLSLTYTLNTNTVYEGIKAALSLAPSGFYYYVDMGTDVLYFKRANTVADIVVTKGKHIDKLTFTATIENVKNQVFFSGGATAGVNLYKSYADGASVGAFGPKLDRKTDNRVTIAATADAIGNSEIAQMKDENYATTVTVLDKTMDITLLKPGLIIGFNGFGSFVDNTLAQVVRVGYTPEEATLTLGILPKRLHPEFDKVTRGLIAQQTIANPTSPS